MAYPGEFDYYAARSGLLDGTLADHQAAYFRTVATYDALPLMQREFWTTQQGLPIGSSWNDAAEAYFGARSGLDATATLGEHMAAFFAVPPVTNLVTSPLPVGGQWNTNGYGTGGAGSISFASTGGYQNDAVGTMTWSTAASGGGAGLYCTNAITAGTMIPLKANTKYTIIIHARSNAALALVLQMATYAAGAALVDTYNSPPQTPGANKWAKFKHEFTTGANVVEGRIGGRIADLTGTSIGLTLSVTRAMIVEGTYAGGWAHGATPGWSWLGATNLSQSRGPAYTIDSQVGAAPVVTQLGPGETTTTLAALPALDGRTMYVVVDRLSLTASTTPEPQFATGVTPSGSETFNFRQNGTDDGNKYAIRPQFTGGGGGAGAYSTSEVNPASPVGRNGLVVSVSQGLSTMAIQAGYKSDATLSGMDGGTGGLTTPRVNLSAPTAYESPVAGYLFRGEHTRATRNKVMAWLASEYGFIPAT